MPTLFKLMLDWLFGFRRYKGKDFICRYYHPKDIFSTVILKVIRHWKLISKKTKRR